LTPVVIEWLDAINYGDGDGEPRHRPAKQTAIGFLLRYDRHGISYCSEYAEDGTWRDETFLRAQDLVTVYTLEE